jgi:hypothetical protein
MIDGLGNHRSQKTKETPNQPILSYRAKVTHTKHARRCVPTGSRVRYFLRASLGDSSRSIGTLLRTAMTLGACVDLFRRGAEVVLLHHDPLDRLVADRTPQRLRLHQGPYEGFSKC